MDLERALDQAHLRERHFTMMSKSAGTTKIKEGTSQCEAVGPVRDMHHLDCDSTDKWWML